MKLVVIQGNVMARFVGNKRDVVVSVSYWDFEGVRHTVEEFRANGFAHG